MKDSVYIIFAGIIFILIFAVFGLILYFNMIGEVKTNNFSNTDLMLNSFVNLADKAIHNMLVLEVNSEPSHRRISYDELSGLAGNAAADSFLSQTAYDIMFADSFVIVKDSAELHLLPVSCLEKNAPFLKGPQMSLQIMGFGESNPIEKPIQSELLEHMTLNPSYGFFEKGKYLVNYKSSSVSEHRYRFVLVFIRLKSDVLKYVNDTTLMFVVLLILAMTIISVFIFFYIGALSNVIKLEEEKKKEIELLRINRIITMERLSESIVHNINNPLTNVKGFLQILLKKRPELSEEYKLDIVMRNLNFVIEQLKSILAKNKNHSDTDFSPVDINSLINSELELLRQYLSIRSIELSFELDSSLPYIQGDYNDFKMVFLNLIDNAVDSMIDSQYKTLQIKTEFVNRNVVLTISDTGCGMTDEVKQRIFEIYYTTKSISPTTKDDRPVGTGIGLFSVQKIVQKYNGIIEVSSIPDKGSQFVIKFPIN